MQGGKRGQPSPDGPHIITPMRALQQTQLFLFLGWPGDLRTGRPQRVMDVPQLDLPLSVFTRLDTFHTCM